ERNVDSAGQRQAGHVELSVRVAQHDHAEEYEPRLDVRLDDGTVEEALVNFSVHAHPPSPQMPKNISSIVPDRPRISSAARRKRSIVDCFGTAPPAKTSKTCGVLMSARRASIEIAIPFRRQKAATGVTGGSVRFRIVPPVDEYRPLLIVFATR